MKISQRSSRKAKKQNPGKKPGKLDDKPRFKKREEGKPKEEKKKDTKQKAPEADKLDIQLRQLTSKEDPIFAESIFSVLNDSVEASTVTRFELNCSSYCDIARKAFTILTSKNQDAAKKITQEMFIYYSVALLWARLLHLKSATSNLSFEESQFYNAVARKQYVIPSPILMYLKAMGKIIVDGKEHINPHIPGLPLRRAGQVGGWFGPVDVASHNLYEEYPCMGVCAKALMQTADPQNMVAWDPPVVPAGYTANENFCGFYPMVPRRPETVIYIINCGIAANAFAEDVVNTGLNCGVLDHVSSVLLQYTTFQMSILTIDSMSTEGSKSQISISRPQVPQPGINRRVENVVTTLTQEPALVNGLSHFFGFQTLKESNDPAQPLNGGAWACAVDGNGAVPQGWFNNRNDHRDVLPLRYREPVFVTASRMEDNYRKVVLDSYVK